MLTGGSYGGAQQRVTASAYTMTGTALNFVSFLFLGFFLGMRHATDADHVVAIATIVSRERSVMGRR
jgi:high-affinity nickel permease